METAGAGVAVVVEKNAEVESATWLYELGLMALSVLERESEVIEFPVVGTMSGYRGAYAPG